MTLTVDEECKKNRAAVRNAVTKAHIQLQCGTYCYDPSITIQQCVNWMGSLNETDVQLGEDNLTTEFYAKIKDLVIQLKQDQQVQSVASQPYEVLSTPTHASAQVQSVTELPTNLHCAPQNTTPKVPATSTCIVSTADAVLTSAQQTRVNEDVADEEETIVINRCAVTTPQLPCVPTEKQQTTEVQVSSNDCARTQSHVPPSNDLQSAQQTQLTPNEPASCAQQHRVDAAVIVEEENKETDGASLTPDRKSSALVENFPSFVDKLIRALIVLVNSRYVLKSSGSKEAPEPANADCNPKAFPDDGTKRADLPQQHSVNAATNKDVLWTMAKKVRKKTNSPDSTPPLRSCH